VSSAAAPDVRRFPCESCGAELTFDIGAQSLACPHCGHKRELGFTSDAPIVERDLNAMLRKLAETRTTAPIAPGRREFTCNGCAATIVFETGVTSDKCTFCGAPVVDAAVHEAIERITVSGLLPFGVSRESAAENLRQWVASRWFAPSEWRRYGVQGKFNGLYLPYWTFDAMTDNRYSGERGDDYTVRVGSGKDARTETRTRWTHASGSFRRFFDDMLVCAASDTKTKLLDALEPWPLERMVPFTADALSGYHALTYDQTLETGFGVAKGRIDSELVSDVRNRIGGDHQRIHSIDTQTSALTFKHILLPVWMLAYRYGDKSYQVMVNAGTGEVQGERPYSPWKIAFAVIMALIVALGVWYLANQS
jgi:predicted RNA-binding Zn-ribbon protein involved in translation (DUF1610 family)